MEAEERELRRLVRAHLDRLLEIVLARLRGPKVRKGTRHWSPPGTKAVDPDEVLGPAGRIATGLERDAFSLVARVTVEVGDETGAAVAAARGAPVPRLDPEAPRIVDAINERSRRIAGATDAVSQQVRETIALSENLGLSLEETAAQVREVFDRADSVIERIVRTEVNGAMNAAATAAARVAGAATHKRWVTVGDDAVRPTHQDAEGQEVGIDETFQVGDWAMRYPGDEDGGIEEIANCRCTMVFTVQEADETERAQAQVDAEADNGVDYVGEGGPL